MSIAVRPRFNWRLRTRRLALGERTLLMGILNVTPDSFSDGGQFYDIRTAVNHALAMLDDGADIIDLGGESTRPSSIAVPPAEEQARVLPVLRAILAARSTAVISIDSYHAETARLAIEAGAEIVNDVSGHLWDPAMSTTCASFRCGAVLMHTRGRPHQWRTQPALAPGEVLPLVLSELRMRSGAALAAGIVRESVVIDPGFGFGKVFDENYPLLAHLDQLHSLGFPILVGVSRKSFLTRTLAAHPGTAQPAQTSLKALPPESSQPGAPRLDSETWDLSHPTTVANTAAILAGAHILRVHDIAPARATAAIADRILQAGASS
jgi:dihydropteroate synthase